jgi:hypothetical protein
MTLPTPSDRATGVKTNGEGRRTTAHLNLTVPLESPALPPMKRDVYRNQFSTKRAQERK